MSASVSIVVDEFPCLHDFFLLVLSSKVVPPPILLQRYPLIAPISALTLYSKNVQKFFKDFLPLVKYYFEKLAFQALKGNDFFFPIMELAKSIS
jgi:hypothetical protein